MLHFSWGEAVFLLAGISIMLPLGMRVAGRPELAQRLDVVPRIVFGVICLVLACMPQSTFHFFDEVTGADGGQAPASLSRAIFGAIGLFLMGTAVRRIVKREFPDDSSGPAS